MITLNRQLLCHIVAAWYPGIAHSKVHHWIRLINPLMRFTCHRYVAFNQNIKLSGNLKMLCIQVDDQKSLPN